MRSSSEPSLLIKTAQVLKEKNLKLVTAESCTAGLLAGFLTSLPGSSYHFDRGFITYSNQSKTEMLDVSSDLLVEKGAVSREVVLAMARGALDKSQADIAIAITGIAGPSGGTPEKPVGTVWIAVLARNAENAECFHFLGDRENIRMAAVEQTVKLLRDFCVKCYFLPEDTALMRVP